MRIACQPLRDYVKRPDSLSVIRIKHQQEKDVFKKMESVKHAQES